jgi:putative DNA primase/helicase
MANDDLAAVPPGAERFVTARRWNGSAPAGEQTKKLLRTRLASEVSPEAIKWAWRGWIAKGKLHVLAGQPGDGKSTIAFEFAATVSYGGRWPDGSKADEGHVLIWSGEDTFADTIVPRLTRMGAKLDHIHCVEGIDENGKRRPFDPAKDIDAVRAEVERIGGVALVIVDPVALVASGRDSH